MIDTDADSFESFVRANYAPVRRALGVAFGDAHTADELTQEAFVRAHRHWTRLRTMDKPVAWVYVVGLNAGRRSLRRAASMEVVSDVTSDHADAVVTTTTLRTALRSLSPRQRAVVVLRYLVDLSTADVATALRCSEGTVKSTLHSALHRLRIEIEE